jgi:hypothetical protein
LIDRNQRFEFVEGVIFQRFDEEALLVNLNNQSIYKLNPSGAEIAELISRDRTVQEILNYLSNEYGVSEQIIERDMKSLLYDLIANELLLAITK